MPICVDLGHLCDKQVCKCVSVEEESAPTAVRSGWAVCESTDTWEEYEFQEHVFCACVHMYVHAWMCIWKS